MNCWEHEYMKTGGNHTILALYGKDVGASFPRNILHEDLMKMHFSFIPMTQPHSSCSEQTEESMSNCWLVKDHSEETSTASPGETQLTCTSKQQIQVNAEAGKKSYKNLMPAFFFFN